MARPIRIGTRGSALALWQANWVREAIRSLAPRHPVELVVIKTRGDKILDVPLARVGGKGLFVKEIEEALLAGAVDVAVHSMKDMPAELLAGLVIGPIPQREDPRDALLTRGARRLDELPAAARVGTSSLRRAAQLKRRRPDLQILPLRGNLDTRVKKLDGGELDAVVLAAAGLRRLGLAGRITQILEPAEVLPAVAQGALCIELRAADTELAALLAPLDHGPTHAAVQAERAFLRRLEGGCQVPIAGHAVVAAERLVIDGLVAELDGATCFRDRLAGAPSEAAVLGWRLAERLLALGAGEVLARLSAQAAYGGPQPKDGGQ